ncbi:MULTISPECIES: PhzF family phenazine biosynthesis protein [unclassified Polaromonas]|uniref:PhzF family phenazine biosynthesis protein n=1 Tax=unclassified Polaromonas TaxID=2638319 RepID=UPI000F080605|nr:MULTISPECIES: PhzF family phenazine biosynthesis protein [unclassified Polaromonas]AYQ28117.1 PhzF family phenazine biosynthesis protein [Polaromonas sp. SP1]QGJ17018.1 PhzF family phenazine biosynthesis isomerase [Polaromonas sp. Pch-P]
MKQRAFKQVDVFTPIPYFGNPLAVVMDGAGLDDDAMQRFAKWTNLSETTFLLPPTDVSADYSVRIFTPGGELPFAGHPTLGSCHSWLEAGGQPHSKDFIVQECKVGLVKIRRETGTPRLAFAAPALKRSAPSPSLLAQVAGALGLKATSILAAQCLDNGPMWMGLLLDSPETVLQMKPDHKALAKLGTKIGVVARYPHEETAPLIARANREAKAFTASTPAVAPDFEVRAFASPIGIDEDPVTGSLNASLAQWLIAEGHAPERYTASQGVCLGRAGQVHIERDAAGQVWVGGESVTCIDGSVTV